jgi:hypothetical protein
LNHSSKFVIYSLFLLCLIHGLSGCASKGSEIDDSPAPVSDKDDGLVPPEPTSNPAEASSVTGDNSAAESSTSVPLPVMKETPEPKAEKSEPVKSSESAAPKKVHAAAKTSSKAPDKASAKGAFKVTTKKCAMKSKPSADAKTLVSLPKGRKVWVEKSGKYYKVHRTKDVGYLAISCF